MSPHRPEPLPISPEDLDLTLVERFSAGYFSGVKEAADRALQVFFEEVQAREARVQATQQERDDKRSTILNRAGSATHQQAYDAFRFSSHSGTFRSLVSALCETEEGGRLQSRAQAAIEVLPEGASTLRKVLESIFTLRDPKEVLDYIYLDPANPTPEVLDLLGHFLSATQDFWRKKMEEQGFIECGQRKVTVNAYLYRPLRLERLQGSIGVRATVVDPNNSTTYTQTLDFSTVNLGVKEARLSLIEILKTSFLEGQGLPANSREIKAMLAKALVDWLTKEHNPKVTDARQFLDELRKGLDLKELGFSTPAVEATPDPRLSPWEHHAFQAELPNFAPGVAEKFKQDWCAAAIAALAKTSQEPIEIGVGSMSGPWMNEQRERLRSFQVWEGRGQSRWLPEWLSGPQKPREFQLDRNPSAPVAELYSAYSQALQIREVGAQLCQLAVGQDTETYKKGLALLALGHALTFTLKKRSIGLAAKQAAGILVDEDLSGALVDMAEVLHANPTRELTDVLDDVGRRASAALEVAGVGSVRTRR